jgi:hypothetical protein
MEDGCLETERLRGIIDQGICPKEKDGVTSCNVGEGKLEAQIVVHKHRPRNWN